MSNSLKNVKNLARELKTYARKIAHEKNTSLHMMKSICNYFSNNIIASFIYFIFFSILVFNF
jgi:hypothetical protein